MGETEAAINAFEKALTMSWVAQGGQVERGEARDKARELVARTALKSCGIGIPTPTPNLSSTSVCQRTRPGINGAPTTPPTMTAWTWSASAMT